MNVKNRRCIRRLSFRQLKASRNRNIITVVAIALTTLLFTSLFTVALSLNASYEEYIFRQIGGYSHGTFKDVDARQIEDLTGHKKVKSYGLRTVCGSAVEAPFAKTTAEISWMDANCTKWSYAMPTTGRMPEAGMEVAMDTEALRKLGVPAELGQTVKLRYTTGNGAEKSIERSDTFTLVGFWEYDPIMPVHYINVSEAYVRQVGLDHAAAGGEAFRTDLNVMLASSMNIRAVMESIERDLGYQWEDLDAENCVRIGTNWGYTSSELESQMDPQTLAAIAAFLLLVSFTGYLIIYNIFQISVSNDVRFYGLLKTIGTTPRQIRRIVRLQALYLSVAGIPLGCALGYWVGAMLTPVMASASILTVVKVSASPLIFAGAALFALATVCFSCARPGRKAARITPVEAVRYTESASGAKKERATRGAKVNQMAYANLGRNRAKTVLVILSLSLAVVLLNCVFTFTDGFDMEKYVDSFSIADFTLGTPAYYRFRGYTPEAALADETIAEIQQNTRANAGGAAYTVSGEFPKGWLSESEFRAVMGPVSEETLKLQMDQAMKRDGLWGASILLEGLDEALLEKLEVYEGSLEPLTDPSQNAIALAGNLDEAGKLSGAPKKLGDTLTISYVDEAHYYDTRTGELCDADTPEAYLEYRVIRSHDVTYTVCALVGVPYGMSHRFALSTGFGAVLTADALRRAGGADVQKMVYLFDAADAAAEAEAEAFLAEYTAGENSGLMYESKALLRADFESFREMFLLVGTSLCFIVALVGVLNFFNAILTGILTRRREFAMLQSVGMTGRQLKQMLVCEGVFYAAGAGALTLALSLALNPLVGMFLGEMFWFFSYRFTILPALIVIPVFVLLGALMPLVIYKFTAKKSIVERLREAE